MVRTQANPICHLPFQDRAHLAAERRRQVQSAGTSSDELVNRFSARNHARVKPVIMLRLFTFGGLWLEAEGRDKQVAQPRRLALLALVASAGRKGISRDRVLGFLWPEATEERARHSLSQVLYSLRKELGVDPIVESTDLRLDTTVATAEIAEFQQALEADDAATVARLYNGPFLDGFHLSGAPEFEAWMEVQRAHLQLQALKAIEILARASTGASDWVGATDHWRHLARLDPLNARYAAELMRALAASGNRAGALKYFQQHEALVRADLDVPPERELLRLVDDIRAGRGQVVEGMLSQPSAAPATAVPPPSQMALAVPARRRASDLPEAPPARWRSPALLNTLGVLAAAFLIVAGVMAWKNGRGASPPDGPVFAVGTIQDHADSSTALGVLPDMVATSLATVAGIHVVGTSRLYELTPRDADETQALPEAARRAGATDLLEGELALDPGGGLLLTLRRVNLGTGLVSGAVRGRGLDRYAAVDSATFALVRSLGLAARPGSVSAVTTSSPAAYGLYQEGLRAFYQWDVPAAHRLMLAALEEDSTFAQAAYYAWWSETLTGEWGVDRAKTARRLATKLPDLDRLLVMAHTGLTLNDPLALAQAESLAVRHPDHPEVLYVAGTTRYQASDFEGAKQLLRRAIELDVASGGGRGTVCRLCMSFRTLADLHRAEDSLEASAAVSRQWMELLPQDPGGLTSLSFTQMAQGKFDQVVDAWHRLDAAGIRFQDARTQQIRLLIHTDQLAEANAAAREAMVDIGAEVRNEARWLAIIALRQQGRHREAMTLLPPTGGEFEPAILAFETGRYQDAAGRFRALARHFDGYPEPHLAARNLAWRLTLAGMAHAAAGDTAVVRGLADSVEVIGKQSLYGRDPRLHWYLRGLLAVAAGNDAQAAELFRRSIGSPTSGLTRANWELARCLTRLGRPAEAIPYLRAGLHGGLDGSNLYVTRTELREALAQAFEAAGQRDSARIHYGAVAKAWAQADPPFFARRAVAALRAAG